MRSLPLLVIVAASMTGPDARGVEFCGVDFPSGALSFADAIESYDPTAGGGAAPNAANGEPSNAIGAPDANNGVVPCTEGPCSGDPFACPFVSLGDGGNLVVRFTDNQLTGSGDSDPDLWVFEVGPDVEDTFVEISSDGVLWEPVGKVFGSIASVDIDAFGFGPGDSFSFVRLTDDTNEGGQSGASVGADIDAVGAISTIEVEKLPSLDPVGTLALGVLLWGAGAARARSLSP